MILHAIVLAASIDATCSTADRPPSVVQPAVPNFPMGANPQGDVIVRVTVGADAKPIKASVIKSSGDAAVDGAAARAAMISKYSPQTTKCVAVTGTYIFRVRMHGAP